MNEFEKTNYTRLVNAVVTVRDGAFGKHTGFAPIFKSGKALNLEQTRDQNIESKGKGEIGLIMSDFQWNSYIASNAFTELAKPMYDKRIWDDRGSSFKAPTVRGVTDMALTVATTIVTSTLTAVTFGAAAPSLLLIAAVNMMDDVAYAGLDFTGGYKDPAQIGTELGTKAAIATVGAVVGAGAIGIANTAAFKSLEGGMKIAGNVVMAGGQSAINTTASTFVNSVDLTKLGTPDWFNADAFATSMTSKETWAGTVSSMVGAGVAGGLGELNLGTNAAKVLGFNSGQIGDMGKMNAFAGSMAGTAVSYGMTGNAKFNLVQAGGVGLLEMNLGKDGFSMEMGMGGMDVSAGTIGSVMRGAQNWGKNTAIENYTKKKGSLQIATALRSQWGFGDSNGKAQLASILDGTTTVQAGNGAGEGKTELVNGRRVVSLNGYKNNMTQEEQLMLGITMQHEAYRDGIVTANNSDETVNAVYGHTTMAVRMGQDERYTEVMTSLVGSSENLQADIAALQSGNRNAFAGYVDENYDSTSDSWLIKRNGDVVPFGENDTLSYQDGTPTQYLDDPVSNYSNDIYILSESERVRGVKTSGDPITGVNSDIHFTLDPATDNASGVIKERLFGPIEKDVPVVDLGSFITDKYKSGGRSFFDFVGSGLKGLNYIGVMATGINFCLDKIASWTGTVKPPELTKVTEYLNTPDKARQDGQSSFDKYNNTQQDLAPDGKRSDSNIDVNAQNVLELQQGKVNSYNGYGGPGNFKFDPVFDFDPSVIKPT